jgi:hypothetical protein
MNTSQTNDLIVTYTDGTHDHFKFPAQADSFHMANLVEKFLSSAALALPSHREQSNVGLCASFTVELGGLSYMKEE